ncbi:MAG: right-handed parallel beta-helix repeat-containing protein [Muribaculum sp.]|nr:right-handed parallel beta-helix repeat-containing protein [Muribaculum sp.]
MNTKLLLFSLLAGCAVNAYAEYKTLGDGTTYTLNSLSQLEGTGVVKDGLVYTMTEDITVLAGDKFDIEGGSTVKMESGITLRIEGVANFIAPDDARVVVTRSDEEATPKGVYVLTDLEGSGFRNIDFEYAALRSFGTVGFNVENCTFRYANGKLNSSGALSLGKGGAKFEVKNCTFEYNVVPAIGGAANMGNGALIQNCVFRSNNTENRNKPQVNISVGGDDDVIIKDCQFYGGGDALDKVGGISIANSLGSINGANNAYVENCYIADNRYGITGNGGVNLYVRNNQIVNNNHETNPANGGSGISMYKNSSLVASGNLIENSLWGITLINCKAANLGEIGNEDSPGNNVFRNNGNNGVQYDLYNNSTLTVYAQNNIWSVSEQTAELIETVIFHKTDDSKLGEVIFMPAGDPASIDGVADDVAAPYVTNGALIVPAAESGNVEVYTMDGMLVGLIPIVDYTADLLGLAPSTVYVLRVLSSDYSAVIKYRN